MKYKNRRIMTIQAALVLVISLAASYSLPDIGIWVFLVFAGLVAVGTAMIFFPKIGPVPFSLLAGVASLPAILLYNTLDLGTIKYAGFQGQTYVPPQVYFPIALALGLLIISGYLVLSYLNSLQKDYQTMIRREAEVNEVEDVTNRNLSIIWIILAISIAVAVIIAILLKVVQPVVSEYLEDYPWSIMVLGLAAILFLAGFLYWMGSKNPARP
jgi:type III secretory pathway component EscS